jgi:hypothetical protein
LCGPIITTQIVVSIPVDKHFVEYETTGLFAVTVQSTLNKFASSVAECGLVFIIV